MLSGENQTKINLNDIFLFLILLLFSSPVKSLVRPQPPPPPAPQGPEDVAALQLHSRTQSQGQGASTAQKLHKIFWCDQYHGQPAPAFQSRPLVLSSTEEDGVHFSQQASGCIFLVSTQENHHQ